jgi:hypothetical protein
MFPSNREFQYVSGPVNEETTKKLHDLQAGGWTISHVSDDLAGFLYTLSR